MKNEFNQWYVATVSPPPYPSGVYHGWTPCMDWCRTAFGGDPAAPITVGAGWRYLSEGVFEFERELDRTAFLLRWS